MLYNRNWEKTETKPDVFSLESLIAWLETMPADGTYDSSSIFRCLLTQWLLAAGCKDARNESWRLGHVEPFCTVAAIGADRNRLRTFSAALSRARALQHKGTV